MPYFLPHVYPSPRASSAPRPTAPTGSTTPKSPKQSATFSAARKLAFLRTPMSSSASAQPTSGTPSSASPAWLNSPPPPRSPASGLHRTRKARATTTLSLAHVSASAFRPAAPAADKVTVESQEVDALRALSAVAVDVKVTVETRVEVDMGPATDAQIPVTVTMPIVEVMPRASLKSLRTLAVPTQTNIIPFPTTSPTSPVCELGADGYPATPRAPTGSHASERSSSSHSSAYASAECGSLSSSSSSSGSDDDTDDARVHPADESDTSVEDAAGSSSGEEQQKFNKVLQAFPAPPSFVPIAFPHSPGPPSPVTAGTHHLLRAAASSTHPTSTSVQEPTQPMTILRPRPRRASTKRAPAPARAVPPPLPTRTVSSTPVTTPAPILRSSSRPQPLAASASVPRPARRLGALPRRSIVDDREVPERARSPVLGRSVNASVDLDGMTERQRAKSPEVGSQGPAPASEVRDEGASGSGSGKARMTDDPPPYSAPPPPYTLSPPSLAAPALALPSSAATTDVNAPTATPASPPAQAPASIEAPAPVKPRPSQIPQLKLPAERKPRPEARRPRVPSAELRILVYLYRTVVFGLERRYRREQALARLGSSSSHPASPTTPLSAFSYSSASTTSSAASSRSASPTPGEGFARFPLVEDAEDEHVRAEDDDEVLLAPTPASTPSASPSSSPGREYGSAWRTANASAASLVSQRSSYSAYHARRRAEEARRQAEERKRKEDEERRKRERAEMDVQDAVLAIRLRKFLAAQGVPRAELDVPFAASGEEDGEEGERGDLELPEGVLLEEDDEVVGALDMGAKEEDEDEDAEAMAACEAEMQRIAAANARKAHSVIDDNDVMSGPSAAAAACTNAGEQEDHILLAPASHERKRTPSGPPRPARALRASPPPPSKSPVQQAPILPASYMIALLTMRHRYASPPPRRRDMGYGKGGRRSALGVCAWMGVDGVVVEDEGEGAKDEEGESVWDSASVVEWYAGM